MSEASNQDAMTEDWPDKDESREAYSARFNKIAPSLADMQAVIETGKQAAILADQRPYVAFGTRIATGSRGGGKTDAQRRALRDGEPCDHTGCLNHISHPCDGCGRVGGRRSEAQRIEHELAQLPVGPERFVKEGEHHIWDRIELCYWVREGKDVVSYMQPAVVTSDAGVVEGIFTSYESAIEWAKKHRMNESNVRGGAPFHDIQFPIDKQAGK